MDTDHHPLSLELALRLSDNPRPTGNGWLTICPAHDDTTPSLHLTDTADGRVLKHCFGFCTWSDISNALQKLGIPDHGPQAHHSRNAEAPHRRHGTSVATGPFAPGRNTDLHHYRLGMPTHAWAYPWQLDPDLATVILARYRDGDDKTYRPWTLLANRKSHAPELRCLAPAPPHPLFLEHHVQHCPAVLVTEGEKAALATRPLMAPIRSLAVTSTFAGTSGATTTRLDLLANRLVIVAYDDDQAGNRSTERLSERMRNHGLPPPATLLLRRELPNPNHSIRLPKWDPADPGHDLTPDTVADWIRSLPPEHPLSIAARLPEAPLPQPSCGDAPLP